MVYKVYVPNYVHDERVTSEHKIFESIDVFVEIASGQTWVCSSWAIAKKIQNVVIIITFVAVILIFQVTVVHYISRPNFIRSVALKLQPINFTRVSHSLCNEFRSFFSPLPFPG